MYRFILILLLFPALVSAAQPNVLLITIDTLRADRLGAYGRKDAHTPNLDSLASGAVLFENAVCQAPLTLPSHTSLLTGRYPFHHGTHDNSGRVSDSETTLAEILKQSGYHTYAAVGGFPLDHRFGLDQGFEVYDDTFARASHRPLDFGSERPADEVVRAVSRFKLASPYFLWVHFYDPHAPYLHGGYEGEIAFVDTQVGRLRQMLPLQNTLIAVAGDHGESLGEHGEWTHRIFIYDSTLRVPFWISAPGLAPRRIAQQARLIDFVPTVLSLLGIKTSAAMDGVVLPEKAGVPAVAESLFPQLQLGWSPLVGIRTPEWKYIEAPKPELYDLKSDPAESRNVIAQHPEVVKKLKPMLPATSATSPAAPVDPETAERLASLGYVGGGSASAGSGADPKDRIEVWNDIEKAVDLENRDAASAIAVLETARKADPDNPMILSILSEKYAEAGKLQNAEQVLTLVLKRDPQNALALTRMAHVQLKMGRATAAQKIAEQLLARQPESAEAHLIAAQACMAERNAPCAASHMNAALKVDPGDTDTRNDLANLYLQQDKPADAGAEFTRVLRDDPKNLQALNGLATIAFNAEKYADCEATLGKALRIGPGDPQTQMNLALLYATTNRKDRALALYRKIAASADTPPEWKSEAQSRIRELEP